MMSLAHKGLVPVPAYNAFASVHLNTVHSLPPGIRNDPIALEAARALQRDCRKYLAYVAGRAGVFQHHSEHNASDIFLVLPGPPVPFLCGGVRVDATMTIPIDQPNVSGRRPLRPSRPLPLPNCYMSPFWRMTVRSPTVYEDEERVTHRLDTQDAVDFMDYVEDDYCVWRPQTSLSALDNPTEELVESNAEASSLSPDSDISAFTDLLVGLPSVEEVFPDLSLSHRDMITVTFSHDVSEMQTVNDPSGLYAELEALNKIVRDALSRSVAAGPGPSVQEQDAADLQRS